MIKTFNQLIFELKDYKNPKSKIARLVKNGNLIKLKSDMYENDKKDHFLLYANYLISPSYISFQYALFFYGLIPERAFRITSATFNKKKVKEIKLNNGRNYIYRDIPKKAFSSGIINIEFDGDYITIASKEKAICDLLYLYKKVTSMKEVKTLVFEELRINEDAFYNLDPKKFLEFSKLYPSTTLKLFYNFVRKENSNGKFIS